MNIDVRSNIAEVTKNLTKVQKDQLPFATSLAINNVATEVAYAVTKQMQYDLDRPTPFTLKAFMSGNRFNGKRATKRSLYATVEAKPIQNDYLIYQVEGGMRLPKKRTIAVPTKNARLNRYGNVSNRRRGLVRNSKQFVGEVKGIEGIWERTGGKRSPGVRLIHAFEESVTYRKRFNPYAVADKVVRRKFGKIFTHALRYATASAR